MHKLIGIASLLTSVVRHTPGSHKNILSSSKYLNIEPELIK